MEKPVIPNFDPAHDVLHYESQALDAIFTPKNVAVIGATENPGSVGRTLLWNLISSPFGGAVFPVNPKHDVMPVEAITVDISNIADANKLMAMSKEAEKPTEAPAPRPMISEMKKKMMGNMPETAASACVPSIWPM